MKNLRGDPVKTLQNTMCAAGRNRVQSVAALRRDEGHKKPNSIDFSEFTVIKKKNQNRYRRL